MILRILVTLGLATGLALSAFAALADSALKLSNKWRIEVSEGANSPGTLLFRVTPDQDSAVDVPVAIKDGRSENDVAKDIVAALRQSLDPKEYHVERDDGEDVLVKKHKEPKFELRLVSSDLKGTRVSVGKE
jgi:hypothetical protein